MCESNESRLSAEILFPEPSAEHLVGENLVDGSAGRSNRNVGVVEPVDECDKAKCIVLIRKRRDIAPHNRTYLLNQNRVLRGVFSSENKLQFTKDIARNRESRRAFDRVEFLF